MEFHLAFAVLCIVNVETKIPSKSLFFFSEMKFLTELVTFM